MQRRTDCVKPNRRPWRLAGAAVLLAAGLSACGSAQVFGIDRSTPDEFAVVSRAPLTLPPDYNLRPPEPGAPRPQEGTASDQASRILAGDTARPGEAGAVDETLLAGGASAGPLSSGERTLLASLGTDQADPEIRTIVDAESAALYRADDRLLDRLLFWRERQPDGTVLDASGEARRLAENDALGAPINEGEVPIIERRQRALLEGIFN